MASPFHICLFVSLFVVSTLSEESADPPEKRAADLLKKMTTAEKFSMVYGINSVYAGSVTSIPRLNIPFLHLEDGPQGVSDGVLKVTAWPSALTVVASWDRHKMHEYTKAICREERDKGTNVWLGPMVNLARVPMGGRNFESYGEDPVLAAGLVRHAIIGCQSQGVIATVKHFVDNNQEINRGDVSSNLDERTQHELYYPAFEAAIQAQVGAVMCSYNKVNGIYACENNRTLNGDLKGKMGFKGFVMSDWGATHSTVASANGGLDMQMPDDSFFGKNLVNAVNSGQVPMTRVDDMVLRILTAMYQVGIMDNGQYPGNLDVNVTSHAHTRLARELSESGTVLLKNDVVKSARLLPIDHKTVRRIAVIGDDGGAKTFVVGRGSGGVIPPYNVTPFEGIKSRASRHSIQVVYAPTSPLANAMDLAKGADLAIVFVATYDKLRGGEGNDRLNLSLNWPQDDLVVAVRAVQPKTIVVVHTPGATVLPWADSIPAILCAFVPGQETGNAIANILFGDVNPAGKLPVTFPKTNTDIPLNSSIQYPGINLQANYTEKLLVGYRWNDAKKIAPTFPFGHGLSYTSFVYSNLTVASHEVSLFISNSGARAGHEVAQLYFGFPASAGEPPKVLRGFERIHLPAGDTKEVKFALQHRDFQVWDTAKHDWKLVRGKYEIMVGSSSRDIRLKTVLNIH